MTADSLVKASATKGGVEVAVRLVAPENVISYTGGLELVYCSAFGSEPWFESARQARQFVLRLLDHTASTGFRLVVGEVAHHLVGFGYGRIALSKTEQLEERYVSLVECLFPEVTDSVFYEAFELTELAVTASWQGQGIGALLHDQLLADPSCSKAWLLTHADADRAQALYRSRGWSVVADVGTAVGGSRRVLMARS